MSLNINMAPIPQPLCSMASSPRKRETSMWCSSILLDGFIPKVNLMDELKKVKRIIEREMPGAPHETLLVLDGTLGQNTIVQARQFHESLGVTGLALTKLDGTARGGVVVAIVDELHLPIRLIGVGEKEDDLQDFNASAFVDALLPQETPPA